MHFVDINTDLRGPIPFVQIQTFISNLCVRRDSISYRLISCQIF